MQVVCCDDPSYNVEPTSKMTRENLHKSGYWVAGVCVVSVSPPSVGGGQQSGSQGLCSRDGNESSRRFIVQGGHFSLLKGLGHFKKRIRPW